MYYNNNSPLIPLGRSSVGEYWSMRHQINFARVGFDTEFEQNEMSRKLSNSFRFNINNYIRPTVTSDFYFLRLNNSFSYDVATALGFDFSPNSRMDLSRIWSNALSRNLISYTLKDSSDIGGWDVTVKIELDDNRTKNASVNLNYRLTENIQVGASLQNQYLGAQIYWNGLLVGKNGPDSWERFDTGTVTGRIEDTSEGEPKPVPGAVIFVGNREATTDDNGYYRVNGVAVDTPVKARIEPTSLDNRLIPDTDYDLLYLRRGTHINWCPVLATTIGLDGYIDSDADIMPGTKVIATRLSDYRVMSTSDIDPADGFFVLERLTPGKYQLSIDRESLKAKPVVIEIKPNTDWISGVRWDIDLSKFEFTKDNENGVVSIEDKITEETVKIPTAEAEETVTVNPVKSPDDDTYAKELRSIQNIIQIKLHNIQLAPDADSSFRLKTYNKLIMITDKMQRDWDKLSTASKISSINKIKLLLFSPLLTKDELDKDHLQKLRLIARERMGKAETVKDSNKLEMYERLNRLLDKLEKEWDKLSRDEKRKKLEGIEKILNYIESL